LVVPTTMWRRALAWLNEGGKGVWSGVSAVVDMTVTAAAVAVVLAVVSVEWCTAERASGVPSTAFGGFDIGSIECGRSKFDATEEH